MLNTYWLRDARNCFLLLLVISALSNLPSAETTKKCNTKTVIPEIKIPPSPSGRTLNVGEALNLTCIAWPRSKDELFPRRRIKYIQWYDPKNRSVGVRCINPQPRSKLRCTLMLKGLTLAQFGNYTCEAENDYVGYCRRKTVEIGQAFLAPETVEDPKNQTVVLGFNVTLNCTAKGSPMPSITWIKDNDPLAIQSNPRIKYVKTALDDKKIHSQLVIKDAKKEDEGKYHCVANNTVGEKTSNPAFLFIKDLATASPRKDRHRSVSLITVLSVFGGTIMTFMCGCTMAFFYRRARRNKQGNRDEGEMYVVCMANNDLAEGIAKDDNHNENGSAPSVINVVAPLVDDEKLNTNMRTERKDPKQDDGSVDSMLLEGRKIPTPPDVEEKNFRNLIFVQKDHAEKLLNSPSGHLSAQDGCDDANVIPHQGSGMDTYKHGDQMLTSLNIALEEECQKDLDDLEVLEEVLGEGEYGIVYKGRCGRKNGNVIDVAIKKLKDDASKLEKAALLNEIRTLKQAGRHPNIVNLIGAWVHGETVFVVTELVRGGSLESLLKSKDDGSNEYANVCCKLSDRQLMNIALQVALGMQHLEERKCIHRDLAARNVFIDSSKVAKVGDFGLARNISDDGLYIKTSCVKIPWRWSSLESLRDRVYTSKSDVWSFGILLWEIATYGELPYPDIESPLSLVSQLSTGYRMPLPHRCSEELYTLMSSCWNENPLLRPSFTDIVNQLEYFLREVKRTYINIMEDEITSRVDLK